MILVDMRRLSDSWYAIDRLEHSGTPFIVARNNFDEPRFDMVQVRSALSLSDSAPLIDCDARDRASSKAVLIALVNHLYALSSAREITP